MGTSGESSMITVEQQFSIKVNMYGSDIPIAYKEQLHGALIAHVPNDGWESIGTSLVILHYDTIEKHNKGLHVVQKIVNQYNDPNLAR